MVAMVGFVASPAQRKVHRVLYYIEDSRPHEEIIQEGVYILADSHFHLVRYTLKRVNTSSRLSDTVIAVSGRRWDIATLGSGRDCMCTPS